MRAKEDEMKNVKCDQCDEPMSSFIGPESEPWANFCDGHGRALTKANKKERGRILESIKRARAIAAKAAVLARRMCSRCDGRGVDPEVIGCTCDCCGGTGFEE